MRSQCVLFVLVMLIGSRLMLICVMIFGIVLVGTVWLFMIEVASCMGDDGLFSERLLYVMLMRSTFRLSLVE